MQLGKLGSSQQLQARSCKTGNNRPHFDQCLTSEKQNLLVVQRDDGFWSIGWHDDGAGPFPTRLFAESVALAGSGVSP
jgi:hypothetical protein